MMADRLYLYAIVAGVHPLESELIGLGGAVVTLLPNHDLAGVVSAVDTEQVRPDPEQLLCHEGIIEALMLQRSTLPVRFGTVLDSDCLLATLAERYATFAADLERLAGQVEIGVRVLWDAEAIRTALPEPSTPVTDLGDERPGTRYLLARSREAATESRLRDEAEALQAWCRGHLQPLASDMVMSLLVTPGLPVSAAFLAPRCGMAAFIDEAARMQCERPDLGLVCTGPWPPYHFVTK